MTDTYYIWTNNYDGTVNNWEVKNGIPEFKGVSKWPPDEGIEPPKQIPIKVNIKSSDTARMVKKKTKKAIYQYENPIEGEFEEVHNQQALEKLE